MPNTSEKNRLNDVLKWEEENYYSREKLTLASGQNLKVAAVLGKITKSIPTTGTADGGNTGDGTCTGVSGGVDTKIGTYLATCIAAAANGGTFRVEAPDGAVLGDVEVGSAFSDPQINLTLNDGDTDFVVGDKFTIEVTAGSDEAVALSFSAVDGSQDAYGILIDDYDASAAARACVAIVRTAVIVTSPLKWKIPFTSGGTHELAVGEKITGATSGETAYITAVEVTSGSWAGGDAAGNIIVDRLSGDFQDENIKVGEGTDDATVSATKTVAALAKLKAAGIIVREEA